MALLGDLVTGLVSCSCRRHSSPPVHPLAQGKQQCPTQNTCCQHLHACPSAGFHPCPPSPVHSPQPLPTTLPAAVPPLCHPSPSFTLCTRPHIFPLHTSPMCSQGMKLPSLAKSAERSNYSYYCLPHAIAQGATATLLTSGPSFPRAWVDPCSISHRANCLVTTPLD